MKQFQMLLLVSTVVLLSACGSGGGDADPTNQAPIADAGIDQTVQVDHIITISGSGSDTDGNIQSYQWEKGASVLANTASFNYTATTIGTDTLTLTVTDNDGAKNSDTMRVTVTADQVIVINDDYQVENLGLKSSIKTTISLGDTAKDLYLVFSNHGSTSADPTIIHNAKPTKTIQPKSIFPASTTERPVFLHTPRFVHDFSTQIRTLLSATETSQTQKKTIAISTRSKDVEGTEESFCARVISDGSCKETTTATVRKVSSNITTNMGSKTLNIWVSNDSFDSGFGCDKVRCLTQDMIDQLADTFLTDGLDNDIYDWVTNIYGEEWGSAAQAKFSNVIPENNEITILLTDIDADNNDGTSNLTGGYFSWLNNLSKSTVSSSNERIMFVMDAVIFANTDYDGYFQDSIFLLLAHEFQHMIHFYQKELLWLDDGVTATWINELLSMSTEDMVATKLQNSGLRNVIYTDGSAGDPENPDGWFPIFNVNNTRSLDTWEYLADEDYSKVTAFGAYLVRNYGGAKLLHDIMHNIYNDKQAVVDAVNKSVEGSGKTFDDLLHEWGIAVMLSDHDDLVDLPFYNTGDFTYSTYNGIRYEMGSINFFNYNPLPTIYTTAGTVHPQGNYYYKIGDDLTGNVNIDIELNGEIEVTLIAK